MDINQLRYFTAIAAERNFTRAARKLSVTQPALTHQIQKLEHELGGPVFDRANRTISLTPVGNVLLPYAHALIAQLEQAKNEILAHTNAQVGSIRIGTTQSFNAVYLKRLVKEFATRFPNTKFEVQELSVPEIEEKLQSSVLDIGFSYFPAKHPLIEEHILYTEELVAIAPDDLLPDKAITFRSLCAFPMALPNQNTQTRRIIDEHARQSGASINPVFESNIIGTNIELARELNLVTIASRDQCQRIDGMFVVNIKDKMPMRQTCVIFRKGAHRTKLLQEFMSLAVDITGR